MLRSMNLMLFDTLVPVAVVHYTLPNDIREPVLSDVGWKPVCDLPDHPES